MGASQDRELPARGISRMDHEQGIEGQEADECDHHHGYDGQKDDTAAADQTLIDTIRGSFQPTDPHVLSCP
jgi:hypothetical protein